MASLDQNRMSLEPTTTLLDALTGGGSDYVTINGERRHVIGYMKDFLFGPEQARTPIGKLSGGERGRLMLARALSAPSNLMVLDEPTNDLDIETLDILQELVGEYRGTILIVSHDRDFLDRVATSVVVSAGGGAWVEYAGGYSDMVAQRGYGLTGSLLRLRRQKPTGQSSGEQIGPPRNANLASTRNARSKCCRAAWRPCATNSTGLRKSLRTPISRSANRWRSRPRWRDMQRFGRRSRRLRTNGWRSNSCARSLRVSRFGSTGVSFARVLQF